MEDLWLKHKNIALKEAIYQRKKTLKTNHNYKKSFDVINQLIDQELTTITNHPNAAIVELDYQDIINNRIDKETENTIRKRGVCVIRNVFSQTQANQWNDEIISYIERNDYFTKATKKAGLDQYFSNLQSSTPQIFGLYWSKPQIEARQSVELANTRQFLNRLWQWQGIFNPDKQYTYSDRIRRRAPGDNTLGLSPHIDGGSVERWLDDGFINVYKSVFNGDIKNYQPFDACYRTQTYEIPSPAVCRMFRTYQGWTALSKQGKGDGTLNVVPSTLSIVYILLRALQDDIEADDLCGAKPGKALTVDPYYHETLLQGLIAIPEVEPGDSVWWHPDCIHAVEAEHLGKYYSNVMYISSAPDCEKNRTFLHQQKEAFLQGLSSPDFAPEHYEVDFINRATPNDLTPLGREQMGFS